MAVEAAVKKKKKGSALSGIVPVKVQKAPAAKAKKEAPKPKGSSAALLEPKGRLKPASNPKVPSLKETPPTQKKKPEFAPPKSGGGEVFDVSAEFAKDMAKEKKGKKPKWML